jgi:pimeloyl-ACP methyl ester carboxylesterase
MRLVDSPEQLFEVPPPLRVVNLAMSDGAIIRLRQHGKPGKPRLALSHGNGLATNLYLPFWLPLVSDFELITFDLRNHGENPLHDPDAHTWKRIARDTGEIFAGIQQHFGAAPTVGAFHSLSAVATLMHELDSGPHWAALALFDPPIFPRAGHPLENDQREDMESMTRRASRRPSRYESPEQFAAQLARQPLFRRWVPGEFLLFAQSTLRPAPDGSFVLCNPRELEARIYHGNVDPILWGRLTGLKQPTIFIGADPQCPDSGPPARICRAIHDELGMNYATIPDTTHFLQIEQPQACRTALVEFLARHELAGAVGNVPRALNLDDSTKA